jgi:hypothetical protein
MRMLRTDVLIAFVLGLPACGPASKEHLPSVTRAVRYETVSVRLDSCGTPLPPVRSDLKVCRPEAIGDSIRAADVCRALEALKEWVETTPFPPPQMQPGDWARVRAVSVCRDNINMSPEQPKVRRWYLTVTADVPERLRAFFVEMWEDSGQMRFGLAHR